MKDIEQNLTTENFDCDNTQQKPRSTQLYDGIINCITLQSDKTLQIYPRLLYDSVQQNPTNFQLGGVKRKEAVSPGKKDEIVTCC